MWLLLWARSGACAQLHRWSTSANKMRRERSTRFNLTMTSVRWSVHKFPKTTKAQFANVKSCSRQGALNRYFRYANVVRPPYGWRLGYSPQGTWNKNRDHRRTDSWLVWYETLSVPGICFLGPTVQTSLAPTDQWSNPVLMADLLQLWADVQGLLEAEQGPGWTETGRAFN